MFKYRKLPVEIEAFRHSDDMGTETNTFPRWLLQAITIGSIFVEDNVTYIKTLEGNMKVSNGDFIIKGIAGELYPCKADIFYATYERVNE